MSQQRLSYTVHLTFDILLAMNRGRLCLCLVLTLSTVLLLGAGCGGGDSGIRSEVVVPDAQFPAKLAFAPDGRLFYSELRTGNIRVIDADGLLLEQPFAHVDVGTYQFWGLFGLAFDPDFETNHYVYAYFIKPIPDGGRGVVMRFTDINNQGTDPTVILADLPQSSNTESTPHAGGGLLFGPDGYLYLSLGDFSPFAELLSPPLDSQDLSVLQGKIVRVNKDGSAPPDNPFVDDPDADPRIFAYGLRNPYDFSFHPSTGRMYANDNGNEDCDELNIVERGQNYGWPLAREGCRNPDAVGPIHSFALPDKAPEEPGSNVGPTALEFVFGDIHPALADSLLACEFNTGFMRALVLGGENQDEVLSDDVVAEDCQLDIAVSPDGIVYYSNQTEIRRLLPE